MKAACARTVEQQPVARQRYESIAPGGLGNITFTGTFDSAVEWEHVAVRVSLLDDFADDGLVKTGREETEIGKRNIDSDLYHPRTTSSSQDPQMSSARAGVLPASVWRDGFVESPLESSPDINPDAADEAFVAQFVASAALPPLEAAIEYLASERSRTVPPFLVRPGHMDNRYVKEHKGYLLHFSPQRSDGKRYLAFLIIKPMDCLTQVAFAGTLELGSFASGDDAAEAGLAAGLRWVDESTSHLTRPTRSLEASN